MELSDTVLIKLTAFGADILNDINAQMQRHCPDLNWKTDYKAGDYYKTELWSLFNDFGENCCAGSEIVFTNLELSE